MFSYKVTDELGHTKTIHYKSALPSWERAALKKRRKKKRHHPVILLGYNTAKG